MRGAHPATPLSEGRTAVELVVDLAGTYAALEGLGDAHPELTAEVDRAVASLHDLAWMARSRVFDDALAPAVAREVERVSLAASILSARREHEPALHDARVAHATRVLTSTIERGTGALQRAVTQRAADDPQTLRASARQPRAAAEPEQAADGRMDRAA